MEELMLKLTVNPGDYILIGDDIKIIFAGGKNTRIPIAIEAPKDKSIIRSTAEHVIGFEGVLDKQEKPYLDKPISVETRRKIRMLIAEDRAKGTNEA